MLSAKMPGRHPHASPCLGYRDSYVETAPAASFPANELGLYDLGGSIWEWCEDWYDDSKSEHVLRGGAYIAGDQDKLLTSARNPYRPTAALSMYFGFRCVLVIDEGK
jgi:formylglycine-generating enzyme required for sulfatase activity